MIVRRKFEAFESDILLSKKRSSRAPITQKRCPVIAKDTLLSH